MIAKAKAISYGINDLRYITGESKHKKHPEKIYRVLDNLVPPDLDAMGIWNSMQLTLSQLYCTPKVGHFWGVFYEI